MTGSVFSTACHRRRDTGPRRGPEPQQQQRLTPPSPVQGLKPAKTRTAGHKKSEGARPTGLRLSARRTDARSPDVDELPDVERISRCGTVKQIALHKVDAQLFEGGCLFGRLDPLGHDLQVEGLGDEHDRRRHRECR